MFFASLQLHRHHATDTTLTRSVPRTGHRSRAAPKNDTPGIILQQETHSGESIYTHSAGGSCERRHYTQQRLRANNTYVPPYTQHVRHLARPRQAKRLTSLLTQHGAASTSSSAMQAPLVHARCTSAHNKVAAHFEPTRALSSTTTPEKVLSRGSQQTTYNGQRVAVASSVACRLSAPTIDCDCDRQHDNECLASQRQTQHTAPAFLVRRPQRCCVAVMATDAKHSSDNGGFK